MISRVVSEQSECSPCREGLERPPPDGGNLREAPSRSPTVWIEVFRESTITKYVWEVELQR